MAGVEPGAGPRTGEGRLSWPVLLLTLAAITSSSLSALSLSQLVALRAEVEGLKSEVCRRREEGQEARHAGHTGSQHAPTLVRRRRLVSGSETVVAQPCLHLLANNSRKTFSKEYNSAPHTGIPWQDGLRRGTALESDGDTMLVREEGYYFVYSQVFYTDSYFVMGHVVIRRKRNVVGDEPQCVVLFRCIQRMTDSRSYNTCYTGGVVKLEFGDRLELLIPRATANVSLYGDATFLGAVKLA